MPGQRRHSGRAAAVRPGLRALTNCNDHDSLKFYFTVLPWFNCKKLIVLPVLPAKLSQQVESKLLDKAKNAPLKVKKVDGSADIIDKVNEEAFRNGFTKEDEISMPANNFSLVYRKLCDWI